ncbi:MAG: hypothetical protein HRU15_14850, partial [Planctomycetes bacterium]|nr:hypothetical protein [Planctomycetota bacterium]
MSDNNEKIKVFNGRLLIRESEPMSGLNMKLSKSLCRLKWLIGSVYLLTFSIYAQVDPNLQKQVRSLSPQESMKTIQIPKGYKLQLVASEPMINEPVLCVWDGNGRMYVAEMNTYMQDADASGEMEAKSRVMLLEDTNGDGKMDKSTVFADNLLLPRMILPLDDRVIIGTTNTLDMYAYTDTDGDGKADKKEMWWAGGKTGGNMEHQASGLVWNIDNWIYMTRTHKRLRFTDGKVKVGDLPKQQSQWGMDCDDRGRVYSCFSGKEKSFQNFQQPWKYGYFVMKGELEPGFNNVWPVDNIPD